MLKAVLHPQDHFDPVTNPGWAPFNQDLDPRRVSKAGYVVSGSRFPGVNGLYLCAHSEESCQLYLLRNSSGLGLARVTNDVCRKLVDEYTEEYCWVLGEGAVSNQRHFSMQSSPYYIQLSPRVLPDPVRDGDPHMENKAWKELTVNETEHEYQSNTKVRVNPDLHDGKMLLGLLDTTFLLAYTFGLVMNGWLADQVDIRRFLGMGMICAGAASMFLGFAHGFGIHSISYFLTFSALSGYSQSVAWPCVITVMGRWFPRGFHMRGFIMGVWNANISLGNIFGSIITSLCVEWGMHHANWPLGFKLPGFILCIMGLLVLGFLEVHPTDPRVGSEDDVETSELSLIEDPDFSHMEPLLPPDHPSLMRVLMIPGLVAFGGCLFFAKMSQQALLFWGPYFLQTLGFSSKDAGYLSSFYDVGGLLGGIGAGWLSDLLGERRGTASVIFLTLSAIMLKVYFEVTETVANQTEWNIVLMILVGFWVNGPVSLITTAVSADLGSHPILNGDERLAGSVAGIIDGLGSLGGAVQAFVLGVLYGDSVGNFLMGVSLLAAAILMGVVRREVV